MMVELTTGALPWRRLREKDEVGDMKARGTFDITLGPFLTKKNRSVRCYLTRAVPPLPPVHACMSCVVPELIGC